MSSALADFSLAIRACRRRPGATALILVSLATTIGISAAAFSVLDAVLWRALPVRNPAELAEVWARDQQKRPDQLTWIEYQAISGRVPGLTDVFAQSRHTATVRLPDRTELLLIAYVSDNYFDALGVGAAKGSVFHTGAARDGEIVISHRYWQRELAGDPAVLEKPLRVNDAEVRVLGVLRPGFSGVNRGLGVDLFAAIQTPTGSRAVGPLTDRKNNDFELVGRLAAGAATDQAGRHVEAALKRVDQEGASLGPGRTALVRRLDGSDQPAARSTSTLFTAVVLLVLLVAAANVANLRLAQNEERRTETSIRLALGAGRFALWRQHATEMLLLSAAGTALSAVVALWLVGIAPAMLFAGERFAEFFIGFDLRTGLFSLGAMLLVALVGTLLPFYDAARMITSPNLVSRGSTRRSRWLPALVVTQVAFVTAIVCVSSLLLQSLAKVSTIRPAMDPDRKLVLVGGYWDSGDGSTARAASIADRLGELPGVRSVAFARRALLSGSGGGAIVPVEMPGQPPLSFRFNQVSPAYFATTGARVLQGRAFTPADGPGSTLVVMVNAAYATRFLRGGRGPVGAWVRAAGADRQVVGIVEDGPTIHLREGAEPYLYFPFAQRPSSSVTFFVEATANPTGLVAGVRRQLASADPSYVPMTIQTMGDYMHAARSEEALTASLAGILGALGLLLAAAGLFGVTLFAVSRRTREFGIRSALGATGATLIRQVVRESSRLVGLGLAAGAVLAYVGCRIVREQLYGMSPWDPWSLLGAALVVVAVCAVAVLQPAFRAGGVDPIVALRQD